MARKHSLVVVEGPNINAVYDLPEDLCTLGRAPDNTIAVDSPRVSRHHAQIRFSETGVVIEDMGSTNGTFVNGRQITVPYPLSPGDTVGLADVVKLEYAVEQATSTEKLSAPVSDGSTQVMRDTPALFVEPEPIRPMRQDVRTPFLEEPAAQPQYAPPPYTPSPVMAAGPVDAKPRRPIWLYVVIFLLIMLICACVALAFYLWNAPAEFWQKVFDVFGIPMP